MAEGLEGDIERALETGWETLSWGGRNFREREAAAEVLAAHGIPHTHTPYAMTFSVATGVLISMCERLSPCPMPVLDRLLQTYSYEALEAIWRLDGELALWPLVDTAGETQKALRR